MEYLVYISIGFFLGGMTSFFVSKIFNKKYKSKLELKKEKKGMLKKFKKLFD